MTDLTFVTIDELADEIARRSTIYSLVVVPKAQPNLENGVRNYLTFYGYEDGEGQNAMVALFKLGKELSDFVVDDSHKDSE